MSTLAAPRRLISGCVAIAVVTSGTVVSQIGHFRDRGQQDTQTHSPRASRGDVRLFQAARQRLDEGRVDEAIVYLQTILDKDADGFFEFDDTGRLISLRQECIRQLEALTGEARKAYTQRYEPAAKALLTEMLARHDPARLAAVARRFPATTAGRQAAYQLALAHIDRGEDLAAVTRLEGLRQQAEFDKRPALLLRLAGCYGRLGETGRRDSALQALAGLSGDVTVNGRTVAAANVDELRSQIKSRGGRPSHIESSGWPVAGGDTGRTSFRGEPAGESIRWSAPGLSDPFGRLEESGSELETELQRWAAQSALLKLAGGLPAAPSARPVAVDGAVYYRTPSQLIALDATSGECRWRSLADPLSWDYLKDGAWESPEGELAARTFVGQRIWSDATWGTPSTDGQIVFAVEETGAASPLPLIPHAARANNQGPLAPVSFNRLVAYEAKTGRRVWEAGGPAGHDAVCAGTYFYGAPIPVGREWFALGESGGVSRLMAFDPARRDSLLWTLPVAEHGVTIDHDVVRRTGGLSPSVAGGILICPLGPDFVVAVDPATRSLLWAWKPPASSNDAARNRRPARLVPTENSEAPLEVIVTARRVLIASPAAGVTAVDVFDGSVAWNSTEFAGVWLIGIDDEFAFLQTLTGVAALRLEDGSPAWSTPAVIGNPSGRGVVVGDRVFVPLADASLAVLDAGTGRLRESRAVPHHEPLGNLIVVGRSLVSQSATRLVAVPIDVPPE